MTKREQRVINAFCNCVAAGEFTESYAITLIEDNQRYGWLSDGAKEVFYDFLDSLHPEPEAEPEPEEESEAEEEGNGETEEEPEPEPEEPEQTPDEGV